MIMIVRKAVRPPYEIIAKDFTLGIEFPSFKETLEELKGSKSKTEYLEKEELALFIKTAYEIPEESETEKEQLTLRQCARALHILAYSGLRIGELCALSEIDIDQEEQKINVIKTLNVQHGIENYILDTPKNETSVREVDVTKQVLDLFKEQEHEKKKLRLMIGGEFYTKEKFIFINAYKKPGYPLSPLEIARYMKLVLEKAKLPLELSPHKLRHTYTSLMAEAGVELAAIQRQLGHANDAMTTRIYLHVTKARRRTDVEKLEVLMNSLN
ncbi:Transposase [compost metagenome]